MLYPSVMLVFSFFPLEKMFLKLKNIFKGKLLLKKYSKISVSLFIKKVCWIKPIPTKIFLLPSSIAGVRGLCQEKWIWKIFGFFNFIFKFDLNWLNILFYCPAWRFYKNNFITQSISLHTFRFTFFFFFKCVISKFYEICTHYLEIHFLFKKI